MMTTAANGTAASTSSSTSTMTPHSTLTTTTTTTTTTTPSPSPSPSTASIPWKWLRLLFLDLPLYGVFGLWVLSLVVQNLYQYPVQQLIDDLRMQGLTDEQGFYPELDHQMTYYNRICTKEDISTTHPKDLMIPNNYHKNNATTTTTTKVQAADIMMTHGAIVIPQVLQPETAQQLRHYLESRNAKRDQLGWQEKFWGEIGRLALGLGAQDDPIISQALREIGQNELVQTIVEGIMGEDPALVEISTLTAMQGCPDQGIHTDSDYFGSSLLYSRTFLHSYTMFMALQNTTAQMGATTLCPGTHMCANPDLENVCLQNGAFEVSSNGKTGSEGVLQQGDAMMFNQNIWHRGPKNHLKENRVMFIVTFVSRRDRHKGDVRIQGMGTYYYQRWTMWSHTFQDLAATGISTMTLPWAALKGLGLFKFPRQTWGISWIEHFARQLANRMDFYADYELPEFTQFLQQQQQQHLPVQVQWLLHDSISSREWETFLPELLQTVQSLFHQLHWVVLGVYVGVHLVAGLLARRLRGCRATSSVASSRFAVFSKWLLALLVGHSLVACIGYAVWEACLSSDLATFIQQGGYRQTPFGNHTPVLLQDTTFPTRQDVLVGSRFDAPFLASYNDVLQYHPGNQRLNQIMKQFQHWDQYLAVEATLNQFYRPVHGITSRILLQDYTAGFWTLHRNPREHVRRTMMSIQKPILGHLNIHLDQVLAESRFGIHRDTIMARKFTQMFALHWSNQLFGNPTTTARFPRRTRISTTLKAPSSSISYSRHPPSTFPFFPLRTYKTILGFFHPHQIEVGDKILANYENSGNYYEATIVDIFDAQICRVEYTNGEETEIMAKTGLRKFRSMLQGDQVVVDMDGDLFHGTLSKIHPLGTADILYQDGEQDQFVQQAQFQFLELLEGDQEELELSTAVLSPKPKSRHRPSNKNVFQVGQRVQADFRRQGEYFEGVIARVKQDGTYVVQYIDGDVEDRVLPQYIIGDV